MLPKTIIVGTPKRNNDSGELITKFFDETTMFNKFCDSKNTCYGGRRVTNDIFI